MDHGWTFSPPRRPALRALVGLPLKACIVVAALGLRSSYGGGAKLVSSAPGFKKFKQQPVHFLGLLLMGEMTALFDRFGAEIVCHLGPNGRHIEHLAKSGLERAFIVFCDVRLHSCCVDEHAAAFMKKEPEKAPSTAEIYAQLPARENIQRRQAYNLLYRRAAAGGTFVSIGEAKIRSSGLNGGACARDRVPGTIDSMVMTLF